VLTKMRRHTLCLTNLGVRHGHARSRYTADIYGRSENALRFSYAARDCIRDMAAGVPPRLLAMNQHPVRLRNTLNCWLEHGHLEGTTVGAETFAPQREVLGTAA
jgi:hypothetical protein